MWVRVSVPVKTEKKFKDMKEKLRPKRKGKGKESGGTPRWRAEGRQGG